MTVEIVSRDVHVYHSTVEDVTSKPLVVENEICGVANRLWLSLIKKYKLFYTVD
jgi:hypothetical protein